MFKSMTGFGKAVADLPNKKVTVEIRSLNSKQLDLGLRLPSIYKDKESELRTEISKNMERGKVDFSIYSEYTGASTAITINRPLAKNYYNELKALESELNEKTGDVISTII